MIRSLLRLLLLSIQLRRDEWKGPGLLGGQGTTAQPLYSVRVCAGLCAGLYILLHVTSKSSFPISIDIFLSTLYFGR